MRVIIQGNYPGNMDDPKLSPSNTLKNGLQIGIAIKWRGYMHNRQPRIQFSGSNNVSGPRQRAGMRYSLLPPPLGPVGNEKFVGDGGIKGKRCSERDEGEGDGGRGERKMMRESRDKLVVLYD